MGSHTLGGPELLMWQARPSSELGLAKMMILDRLYKGVKVDHPKDWAVAPDDGTLGL